MHGISSAPGCCSPNQVAQQVPAGAAVRIQDGKALQQHERTRLGSCRQHAGWRYAAAIIQDGKALQPQGERRTLGC